MSLSQLDRLTSLSLASLPPFESCPLPKLLRLVVRLEQNSSCNNFALWTNLRKLRARIHSGISNKFMTNLTSLTSLHIESCDNCNKTTSSISHLTLLNSFTLVKKMPDSAIDWMRLRKLDAGYITVPLLHQMTQLVSFHSVKDFDTNQLCSLTNLTELCSPLKPDDHYRLNLPRLTRLILPTASTIRRISNFTQISYLEIRSGSVTPKGFSSLTNLRRLKIRGNNSINCRDLLFLSNLDHLTNYTTAITDECVRQLRQLTRLVRLQGAYERFDIQEAFLSVGQYGQRVKVERSFSTKSE